MAELELIMPMAGRGSRFDRAGFELPKPLLPLFGKPFFAWAIEAVVSACPDAAISCVVLQEHVERFGIDKAILARYPQARIVAIPEVTKGALDTAAIGMAAVQPGVPVLVNDCDQYLGFSRLPAALADVQAGKTDAFLCHFAAQSPNYSYGRYDANGLLLETAEKRVISERAIAGAYGFASAELFLAAADAYRLTCPYDELYISGVYDQLVREGKRVRGYDLDFHVPFGTPDELAAAERRPELFGQSS